MSSNPTSQEDNALYTRDQGKHQFGNEGEPKDSPKTCFRCGKEGHFKRGYRVKQKLVIAPKASTIPIPMFSALEVLIKALQFLRFPLMFL
ncbi:hypothetical protein FRX31_030565 [Thalictrum thalictroides]|uniref:CCHC-type domain-containing protein n=1 Tax=Thalictrum thalictroides TaxID=46969 RepID=A0A7J6V4W6_THATH|nr:hypothetical protein FRX31_030565 [Thalictrum thalictroides]